MVGRRKLGLGCAVILVPLVVTHVIGLAMCARQNRSIDEMMASAAAKGEPTCAADLRRFPEPGGQRAALAYGAAFAAMSVSRERDAESMRDYLKRCTGSGKPLRADEWQAMRKWAESHADVLLKAKVASGLPNCRFPVRWEDTVLAEQPHLTKLRDLNTLVCVRALINARNGDSRSATDDILLSLAINDSLRNEPQLVPQLLRYNMLRTTTDTLRTVLNGATPSEVDVSRLDQALVRMEFVDSYRNALTGERAIFRTMFDDLVAGRMGADDSDIGIKAFVARRIPGFQAWVRQGEARTLRYLTRAIELSRETYRESVSSSAELGEIAAGHATSETLCKVYPSSKAARDEAIAALRGTCIALRVGQYRTRYGALPGTLEELRSRLSCAVPADPFSGKHFIYVPAGSGYLLYSIGSDLKDNEGKEAPPNGNSDNLPHDITWRVRQ